VSGLRRWLARIAEWLRSAAVARDADSEIQSHIDLAADDYVRRGLDPAAARAAARRDSAASIARAKPCATLAVSVLLNVSGAMSVTRFGCSPRPRGSQRPRC
jgi:hypothetical protein